MEFNITYDVLFKSTILNYFYLNRATQEFSVMTPGDQSKQLEKYNVTTFFDIIPTVNCLLNLKNYNLIFRKLSDGFSVITLLDSTDTSKSFAALNDLKLTFLLTIKDSYFYNSAALPLSGNNNQIYYFSNRAGLNGSAYPSISSVYPAYVAGADYEMGSIVTFGGNVYEAVETISNSSINPNLGGSGWQLITNQNYANINDRIPLFFQFIPFALPAPGMNVTIQITDALGNIVQNYTDSSVDGILNRKINTLNLSTGKYTLVITNDADASNILTQELYLLLETYPGPVFGVIEIFGDTSLGNYNLTDINRNLNSPDYHLNIKNRSTIWRYINTADRSIVLESGPNPNTHLGFVSIVFNGAELPNPGINVIKPETDKIVSEIFINT